MKKDLKDTLIQTMFKALYHEGYNASNLNDLLKDAGTSKGGLYHHFGSKKELALETIDTVISDFIHFYWEIGLAKQSNPVCALETLLKTLPDTPILGQIVFDFQHGCPLNNLIQEMSALDEDFHIHLNALFDRWVEVVNKAFQRAKEAGILRADVDTIAVAEFTISSIEGCLTMSKVRRCERSYNDCIKMLINFLRTLENNTQTKPIKPKNT